MRIYIVNISIQEHECNDKLTEKALELKIKLIDLFRE